ncbi:MAG: hypothetical protein NXI31_20180 [bacterium]|nr:hypothetical protein [bacterium]
MTDPRIDPQPQPLSRQPSSRPLRPQGYNTPVSGPMRRRHRRHFTRQSAIGFLLMAPVLVVIFYFWGVGIGMFDSWRD